jgi:hypothetical protein
MAQAKVTKVVSDTQVLAESGTQKGIKVAVPVNGITPAEGASIEISEVESVEKAQGKGKPVVILRANMLGAAKAESKK